MDTYTILFYLMTLANNHSDISAFFDPETMSRSASTVYANVGVQIVSNGLRQSASNSTDMSVSWEEQRLEVTLLNVWIMGAVMAILVCLALLIMILCPTGVVPRDPHTLAGLATICASSRSLNAELKDQGHASDNRMRLKLAGNHFQSSKEQCAQTWRFVVQAVDSDHQPHEISQESHSHVQQVPGPINWWRPISVSFVYMTLAVLIPVALIVVLEILQRKSDDHRGFANVGSRHVGQTLSSLLSAFIMVIVALIYDAGAFALSMFAPYLTMRHGSALAKRSLCINHLGQLPILVPLSAILKRHYGVALMSLAALFGSFLTVIVSGLFVVDTVPWLQAGRYTRSDDFGRKWNDSLDDNLAGTMLALLEYQNASYPLLTYEDLALPNTSFLGYQASDRASQSLLDSGSVTLSLNALRGSLNCSLIPHDNTTISYGSESDNGCEYSINPLPWPVMVMFNFSLPPGCYSNGGDSSSLGSAPLNSSIQPKSSFTLHTYVPRNITKPPPNICADFSSPSTDWGVYGGAMTDLHLGVSGNPQSCPSLAFMFGHFRFNQTIPSNVTVYTCSQLIQEVPANVTFSLPKMTIDTGNPPLIDEPSARTLQSTNNLIQNHFGKELNNVRGYDIFGFPATWSPGSYYNHEPMDVFTQTLVFGKDGRPPEELVGPANAGAFLSAVQRSYGKYMAQVITANMRQNTTSGSATATHYDATIMDSTRLRIRQNNRSKLILQALLGTMLALGIAAYALDWNVRQTLPHNPCSIAGAMSLLADSELCGYGGGDGKNVLPDGAEFMTDKELEEVLGGYLFSLGWWGDRKTSGGGQRFGIDVGASEMDSKRWDWKRFGRRARRA